MKRPRAQLQEKHLVQAAVALPLGSTACPTRAASRSGSACRRSRRRSASASASIFLAREGLSYASLKRMPDASRRSSRSTRRRPRRHWRRKLHALACPASLKGVLSPVEPRPLWPRGCGASTAGRATSCRSPTAAREPRRCSRGRSAASGATARVRPARTAGDGTLARRCRTGRRSSSRPGGRARAARGGGARPAASPRRAGLGELLVAVLAAGPAAVLVCVGGTATVDGGAGLRRTLPRWPGEVPLRVLCDVRNPLLGERGAARVFGPQKGAGPEAVEELERRLAALDELGRLPRAPGAGAGGGLGAALASLGGELCEGAELVLELTGFDERAPRRRLRRHRRGHGRRDDAGGQGARRGAAPLPASSTCVASLFGGRVATPPGLEARGAQRRPGPRARRPRRPRRGARARRRATRNVCSPARRTACRSRRCRTATRPPPARARAPARPGRTAYEANAAAAASGVSKRCSSSSAAVSWIVYLRPETRVTLHHERLALDVPRVGRHRPRRLARPPRPLVVEEVARPQLDGERDPLGVLDAALDHRLARVEDLDPRPLARQVRARALG